MASKDWRAQAHEGDQAAMIALDDRLWEMCPVQLRGQPGANSQFGVPYWLVVNGYFSSEGQMQLQHADNNWASLGDRMYSCLSLEASAYPEGVALVWRRPLETGAFMENGRVMRRVSCRLHLLPMRLAVEHLQHHQARLLARQKAQPRGL